METSLSPSQDPASAELPELPDPLTDAAPVRASLAPRWGILLLLVLLTLAPRALLALKMDTICPDATLYIHLAQAIDRGDYQAGLQEMHLNTFPLILVALHRAGLDWEAAGKWWGVFAGTVVILPLFGWIRRMFTDRVAVVACFLYAVHPQFIEWSPDVIRDPTFWLLAATTFHLLWRAAAEVRIGLYVAAGLAMALAMLTRVEGLFLLIPLVFWSIRRSRALTAGRWRPAVGAALCLAVAPILFCCANVLWLKDVHQWQTIRVLQVTLAAKWSASFVPAAQGARTGEQAPRRPPGPLPARMTLAGRGYKLLNMLERGLSPVFALLMLGGIACRRRLWMRGDHRPLFFVSMAVIAAMWIHLWHAGDSSTRYPLLIALMATPWAALGLFALARWLARVLPAPRRRELPAAPLALVLLLMVGTLGWIDSLSARHGDRRARAGVGRWIHREYGPGATIVGTKDLRRLVGYYAKSDYRTIPSSADGALVLSLVKEHRPHFVLLSARMIRREQYELLLEQKEQLGFEIVDDPNLARGYGKVIVLARRDSRVNVADRPKRGGSQR